MFVLPLPASVSRRAVRRHAFDRLFDETLQRALRTPAAEPATLTPALDVSESDAAYTLRLDMPGASREQLEVTVEGRRVHVATAAAQESKAAEGERVLLRERAPARYARTVSLPADVDSASSEARFDHGVLTLTLAKRVPSGARKITVQ